MRGLTVTLTPSFAKVKQNQSQSGREGKLSFLFLVGELKEGETRVILFTAFF